MKEWYLTQKKPNVTSTYENEAITQYAEENFTDILYTDFADDIILYNSDLSESIPLKVVIQGNVANTQLQSMKRTILCPIGTVKAGMYVFFENRYWLVTGYPGNNKSYEKATLDLCTYLLRWQNEEGKIIERWVNITSASKYDIGENQNATVILTSNNYSILIPNDEETCRIYEKRVFIDVNKNNPTKVFKLTRNDDVLYDYGDDTHGSILCLIADKDELSPTLDNRELGICDYFSPTVDKEEEIVPTPIPPSQPIEANILGNQNLKLGFARAYTCECDATFTWNIIGSVPIQREEYENKIKLMVEDEIYIGQSIMLQVIVDGNVVAEKEIFIVDAF